MSQTVVIFHWKIKLTLLHERIKILFCIFASTVVVLVIVKVCNRKVKFSVPIRINYK